MKQILIVTALYLPTVAQTIDSTGVTDSSKEGISPWLSAGMIFFGLLSFVPYIYLTIKEKKSKKSVE